MTTAKFSRRDFIVGAASGIALTSFPGLLLAQTPPKVRLEWQQFKTTTQYASFYNAIRTMRANTNASSPSSWQYWVNVHVNFCPHGSPYFLAWHRGYLYHFERQLRTISGDATLTLPYWDYYTNPRIPSEFTNQATNNPLYQQRTGTSVYNALSLAPFGSTVYNFQRGKTNAYEPIFESKPHDPVHNLIGGIMASMQSPTDPIFYLHHCNVDRLWHAWALPDGKGIPRTANPYSTSNSDPYWSGTFTYASGLTLARNLAFYPGWLGYDYANTSVPKALPPQAKSSSIKMVQAQILTRPARGNFATAPGRAIAGNNRSVGSVTNVGLEDSSVSAQIPVDSSDVQSLQAIAATGAVGGSAGPYKSVKVVLDNIQITGAGRNGGFYYNLYLNLPPSSDAAASTQRHFLGALGPFQLSGVEHHGSTTLEYPASEIVTKLTPSELAEVTVSLERVNGENAPKGRVMLVREIRVELSTDDPFDHSQPVPATAENCYCQR
jgi:tyrosinase